MHVVYAPSEIGEGRRFRIVIHAADAVHVDHDDAVALLDSDTSTVFDDQHRFHFRAERPGTSRIGFRSGADRIEVTVDVIAEREWGEPTQRGALELPRIWPLDGHTVSLKTEHTIVPPKEIGNRRDDPPASPAELEWSDEELFGFEPPCDIPRWHFLNLDHGCPVHGREIYRSDPYYPWIVDVRNRPYAVQCPVGGEWYPTNDYAAGDHTSGDFPDDGWGWHRREPDGTVSTFGFISYWHLRRIREVYGMVGRLSSWFEATGDPVAARKITILLASLAREHRFLCRFPEHRFLRSSFTVQEPLYKGGPDIHFGPFETDKPEQLARSGMDDYCINMPGQYVTCARAYDLVFDRIDGDPELIAFLSERIPEITDGESARRWIETFLLRAGAQASLDDATSSNLPEPQRGMIYLIRALGIPEAYELTDWLVNGGGHVAEMPVNYYYKDGAAYESTGGYNGHHVSALVPIEEGLRALRDAHPELYPADRFDPFTSGDTEAPSRYRDIVRWPLEIVIAQLSHPYIGDIGDIPNTRELPPTSVMSISNAIATYRRIADVFPDDERFRIALELLEQREALIQAERAKTERNGGFYTAERLPEIGLEPDDRLWQPSRLSDGYGVGILESGPKTADDRRGVWLYYGDHPAHSHEQQLDIGLFAHRRNLLRHMGYPYSWQHMDTWDGSWITHHTVRVLGPQGSPWWRTTVSLFHDPDADFDNSRNNESPFRIVEAAGYGVTRKRDADGVRAIPGYGIRRSVCLVDTSPDENGNSGFYALDLFSVTGGNEHWWTFHGPPGELDVANAESFSTQEGGTVAGADVPYGEKTDDELKSLAYLYDVRRGSGPTTATWALNDADGLSLRLRQLTPGHGETVLARGRSPHAPADAPPYELDWLLRHTSASDPAVDDHSSTFISLIESDAKLQIEHAEPILRTGLTGARIDLGEVTHTILRAEDPTIEHELTPGIRFRGRAGFIEREAASGHVRRMSLVGAGSLTIDGRGIRNGAADWRGVITAIDADARTIDIDADTPPESLIGRYLMIAREKPGEDGADTFAYRVEAVETAPDGGVRCHVNWTPRIGAGRVAEHEGDVIVHHGSMPLAASRAYYRMAHLVNGETGARVRLVEVQSSWVNPRSKITAIPEDRAGMAERFPVGSSFYIDEIGPGDAVEVHGWTEIRIGDHGEWIVNASGPAEVL